MVAHFNTLEDFDFTGKKVLVRADLNVPMVDGEITDATRIDRFAPTVIKLLEKGAQVVVVSHFGRPKGQRVEHMSLSPVADALAVACGHAVNFCVESVGDLAQRAVSAMRPGDVLMLENLRFHPEEEANDENFAESLAKLADIYINDAFSCSHRAHASTHRIVSFLPSGIGPSMEAEIRALTSALDNPKRPVAAVIGGAKVSSKIEVLSHLLHKMDYIIIGGGMANTFLLANGADVGKSLCEPKLVEVARDIMEKAKRNECTLLLPSDVVVASEFVKDAEHKVVSLDAVPEDHMILDVGPETISMLTEKIKSVSTLLWNGPLGAFEIPPFDQGTFKVAQAAAKATQAGKLMTVAGGGDTVSALNQAEVSDAFSYLSTAGGAFLEWLEGKELPGIAIQAQKQLEST